MVRTRKRRRFSDAYAGVERRGSSHRIRPSCRSGGARHLHGCPGQRARRLPHPHHVAATPCAGGIGVETVDHAELHRAFEVLGATTGAHHLSDETEPAEDLLSLEGMNKGLAYLLASNGVVTREDLAELATDDLLEINEMDQEEAAALIMKARAHWFEAEQQA